MKCLITKILPALTHDLQTVSNSSLGRLRKHYGLDIQEYRVQTPDGALLETYRFTPIDIMAQAINQQYFIVRFNGNNALLQDNLNQHAKDASTLKASVVCFNYRGINLSSMKPKRFNDLVVDGIAQVQWLLDQGADSKKITLDGFSLGGAVATLVASYFHQRETPVYLWVDRSFATLHKAAASIGAQKFSFFKSTLPYLFLSSLSKLVLTWMDWQVDVVQAYSRIDPSYKSYAVVQKKSQKWQSTGDLIINNAASFNKNVKRFEGSKVCTGYKFLCGIPSGGHNVNRRDLILKQEKEFFPKNCQDVFEEFVRKSRRGKVD